MAMPPQPDADGSSPPDHPEEGFRPDSASIIHTVANRRDSSAAMKDRETVQREQVERNNIGLLLHALHEIADTHIPPAQRRLVQEAEIKRAIAVLRRFFLSHPGVKLEELLDHCEQATSRDRSALAHLIDPLQLRHVLTFHRGIPDAVLTAADLQALDVAVEHGLDAAVIDWFARIGLRSTSLPKATPAYLRTVFARACRPGVSGSLLEILSFESAVLNMRVQGVLGFEDTRLFFSLLKQIASGSVPGLDRYLEAGETNHAVVQHRTVGNTWAADYFKVIAAEFDHTALATLEQRVIHTAAQRAAAQPRPDPSPATAAEPAAPEPPIAPGAKRGFFSGLRGLGQAPKDRS